jgi:AmiR/NasT family two-component response regulator
MTLTRACVQRRALDYILKPVAPARLAAAVEHAVQRVREARALRDSIERESEAAVSDAVLTRLIVRITEALLSFLSTTSSGSRPQRITCAFTE